MRYAGLASKARANFTGNVSVDQHTKFSEIRYVSRTVRELALVWPNGLTVTKGLNLEVSVTPGVGPASKPSIARFTKREAKFF